MSDSKQVIPNRHFDLVLRYILSPSALTSRVMMSSWQIRGNFFPHPLKYAVYICTSQACTYYKPVRYNSCNLHFSLKICFGCLWVVSIQHKVSDILAPLSKYSSKIVVKCRIILWMYIWLQHSNWNRKYLYINITQVLKYHMLHFTTLKPGPYTSEGDLYN